MDNRIIRNTTSDSLSTFYDERWVRYRQTSICIAPSRDQSDMSGWARKPKCKKER